VSVRARVCAIVNAVVQVLISTSADSFFELAACKTRIVAQLTAHGALQIVQVCLFRRLTRLLKCFTLNSSALSRRQRFQLLMSACLVCCISYTKCGMQSFVCVVCAVVTCCHSRARRSRWRRISSRARQLARRTCSAPIANGAWQHLLSIARHARMANRLFRLYQHVIAAMHDSTPPHKIHYYTTDRDSVIGTCQQRASVCA
jgi:hypothetical protein